jgi:hypothetical protein
MLASSAEDRGFGFLSVQNNYYNIGICCLTEEQRKTTKLMSLVILILKIKKKTNLGKTFFPEHTTTFTAYHL